MSLTTIAELLNRAFDEALIEGFSAVEGGPCIIYRGDKKRVLDSEEARAFLVGILNETSSADQKRGNRPRDGRVIQS